MPTYDPTLDQLDFDNTQIIPEYAGFWLRFAAYFIDGIVSTIATYALLFAVVFSIKGLNIETLETDIEGDPIIATLILAIYLGVPWLYYALMESSEKQATVGKIALGLKVVDMYGDRITFARATGRYFAKIISAITILIGYIMAGFTDRKQALHDMIASTLVVKKSPEYGQYKSRHSD
ncbi:MAG: RDD family protein [Chitinophagales bacterium]